ncbi:MAG: hypothetical protein C5B51_20455 [Terriglobia bacterium]|nr:MAG: hypothetical protein C5B51_20455 [Terriglobia bacterium]
MRTLILRHHYALIRVAFVIAILAGDRLSPLKADIIQQGDKLVGSGAINPAAQGRAVALSADGNTAIIGAPGDNGNTGAAWVFTRSGAVWTQQAEVIGGGPIGQAREGAAVALSADGNTALVAGPGDNGNIGAVWVFVRSSGVWTQQGGKLIGSGAVGSAGQGVSVALSGDGNTALIGGNLDNGGTGAAWVFTRTAGTWTQQGGKLVGSGAVGAAAQGFSVALSGDGLTALIGGNADNAGIGAAWPFTNNNGVWVQQGPKLVGLGAIGASNQGNAVSLTADGNTAVVGGPGDNNLIGAAWVFTRAGSNWSQQQELQGAGFAGQSREGLSAAISGDGSSVILGAPADNKGVGAVWIFVLTSDGWIQQSSKRVGTGFVVVGNAVPLQGTSVAISRDGKTVIEGGPGDNNFAGAVWIGVQGNPVNVSPTTVEVPIILLTSANPFLPGRDLVIAAVLPIPAGAPPPTGTVQFFDGGTNGILLGTVNMPPNGQALLTTSRLGPGSHLLLAIYSGDTFYQRTTRTRGQVIIKFPTVVGLVTSSTSAVAGQPVVLAAGVGPAPPAGAPLQTGQIIFRDNGLDIGRADLVQGATALGATLTLRNLSLGDHQFEALYNEDAYWGAGHSSVVTVTVSKASAITALTPSIAGADRISLRALVAALPPSVGVTPSGTVQFVDTTTNAVLASSPVTNTGALTVLPVAQVLTSAGIRPIAAVYSGDSNFKPSSSAALPAMLNGAAFPSSNFAPDEIATIFVPSPVTKDVSATLPLPTTLGGAALTVTDSTGSSRPALLYSATASPGQINFVVPSDTAPGLAVFKASNAAGASSSTIANIVSTAPGIFTANGTGRGAPVGQAIHVHADGSQTAEPLATFDPVAKQWNPAPVSLGPSTDQLYLVLFATGIRGAAAGTVTATVSGGSVPVAFSGPQGTFPGLDQVNLQVPASLAGAGTVDVLIGAGGAAANPVSVAFQ